MMRQRNPFVDDLAGAEDLVDDIEDDDNEPNEYEHNTFVVDDDDDMGDEEGDLDDLDIIQVVKRDLRKSNSHIAAQMNGEIGSDTEDEVDDPVVESDDSQMVSEGEPSPTKLVKERKARQEQREKAAYRASLSAHEQGSSDDSLGFNTNGDADAAYLAFKSRHSNKRKQAAASTRAAKKARAEHNMPAVTGVRGKNKGKLPANTVVGKRIIPQRRQRKEALWKAPGQNDDTDDDENRADDEHLPDYLRNRMQRFRDAQARLGNDALLLPPSYDDVEFSDNERIESLLERPSLPKLKPVAPYQDVVLEYSGGIIPPAIAQWLRPYQVEGAQFLHEAFIFQKGVILGDDMGLGKTIQVISFLTAAFGKTADERDRKRRRKKRQYGSAWYPRVLIICPGSLLSNWHEELDRWGWWDIYTYHGSKKERDAALAAAASGSAEILLTTYDTYKMNMSAINTVDWDCVIADEFHAIKNRSTETTKAMAELNAMCRIGLSGTAIQNNYNELFTLLNWTNPGRFGTMASWKENISEPLRLGQSHNATEWQLGTARRLARSLVDNLLPQFFLRRMKSLIADQLPKKSDRVVFCPLTDVQSDAYANYVSTPLVEFLRKIATRCDCGSGKTFGVCCGKNTEEFDDYRRHVFPTMQTLQKMSNHLAMIIPSRRDPLEKQEKDVHHLKMAFPDEWRDIYADADSIHHKSNVDFCGKWKILQKLLQFWHTNGDKVLIFSHSVKLLKMLQQLFEMHGNYNVSYFDGGMKLVDRAEVVREFNNTPEQFVFLISTKAGGVGLNITSANKVVIMDPNWNPAYDQQAQDRAYRIGQTRDVEVFRLISAGTIEEIVYARQIYKQQQANIGYTASEERRYFTGIQDMPGQKGEIFGLANMFSFQGEGIRLQQMINKTNVAESKLGLAVSQIDMSQAYTEEDEHVLGDEDTAMKELEALITKGEKDSKRKSGDKAEQKFSAVQAILSNAGVSYTHENSEVVGTSRTEARLSRKAAEAATTTHEVANRPVFGAGSSQQDTIKYRYNPGDDVRKRIFCSMAKHFGFKDAVEFALVVEGWTQRERRSALDKFYWARRQILLGGDDVKEPPAQVDGAASGEAVSPPDVEEAAEDDEEDKVVSEAEERAGDDDEYTDDEL